MSDVGWIYSSIIQSTAAFLAIVGGFFSGAILQLVSKRTTIADELDELYVDQSRLGRLYRDAVLKRDQELARDIVNDHEEDIAQDHPAFSSVATAKQFMGASSLDDEAFRSVWEPYKVEVDSIRSQIIQRLNAQNASEYMFERWLRKSGLPSVYGESSLAEAIFAHERTEGLSLSKRQHGESEDH